MADASLKTGIVEWCDNERYPLATFVVAVWGNYIHLNHGICLCSWGCKSVPSTVNRLGECVRY